MDDGRRDAHAGEFEPWVRGHWAELTGLARVITGDPTLAQDVLQDSLVDLHRRWDRISVPGGNPMAYAARVMASKAANYRRTAWARRTRLSEDAASLDSATGDHTGGVHDRLAVAAALASLSTRQRQIVAMHYLLDMSVAEIGEELGRPIGSVTSDLTRARQRLRRDLLEGGGGS